MRTSMLLAMSILTATACGSSPSPTPGSDGGLVFDGGWAPLDGGWERGERPPFDGGGLGYFDRVHGSGPNDVWVVGESNPGVHWNGTVWEVRPRPADVPALASCVAAIAPNDAWVVGRGTKAAHWNGTGWTVATLPRSTGCYAMSASSTSDVWTSDGLRWNGMAWEEITGAPTGNGVWAGGTQAWIVGEGATGQSGAAHLWNGSAWATHALPKRLWGVWGSATNDVWAVGDEGALFHWNGMQWAAQALPQGATGELRSVHGSSATNVWVAGREGALAWNGSAWTLHSWPFGAVSGIEKSVWVESPGSVWFANGGAVYRLRP